MRQKSISTKALFLIGFLLVTLLGRSLDSIDYPWLKNPAPNPHFDRITGEFVPEIDDYVANLIRGYSEFAFSYTNRMLRQSFEFEFDGQALRVFPFLEDKKSQETLSYYASTLEGASPESIHREYQKYYHQLLGVFNHDLFSKINLVFEHTSEDAPLWRGVKSCQYFQGKYFVDHAFVSTSEFKDVAANTFAGESGCLLKIRSGGQALRAMRFSASVHEAEVILEPHQVFETFQRYPLEGNPKVTVIEVESLGLYSDELPLDAREFYLAENTKNTFSYAAQDGKDLDQAIKQSIEFHKDTGFLKSTVPEVMYRE